MILFPQRKYQGRILVVDDEADSREMTSEILVAQGYQVINASSGFEALEVIKNNQLDLVLLDVLMEGLDGFQTLKQIRENQGDSYLPVILLTALDKSHRDFGIETGADDFLTKPYSIDDLIARVKVGLRLKSLHENLLFEKNKTAFLLSVSEALNSAYSFEKLASVLKNKVFLKLNSVTCSLFVLQDNMVSVLPSDPLFPPVRVDEGIDLATQFRQNSENYAKYQAFSNWKCEPVVSGEKTLGCVFFGYNNPEQVDFPRAMVQDIPQMLVPVIERCTLSQALKEEERRLHHIVQNSADALFLLYIDGNAQALNDSCKSFFNLRSDAKQFSFSSMVSNESQRDYQSFVSDVFAGKGDRVELTLAGSNRCLRVLARILQGETIPTLQCSAIDITSEKKEFEKLSKERELLEEKVSYLSEEFTEKYSFESIIAKNTRMQEIFSLIRRISNTLATVLITGETGTGKEMIAKAIHSCSPVRTGPYIKVDCGALSANLLESELFGHVRGAFTGAIRDKAGRFELARGGTIFLDEIGNLPLSLQSKLLRVLQDGSFEPVGSSRTFITNARVIAATNEKLLTAVEDNKFRSDLYFRLNVVSISIPPLRNRKDDIPLLTNHFIQEFERTHNREIDGVDHEALSLLLNYDWPGNIRELRNIVEEAVILSQGSVLMAEDLRIFNTWDTGKKAPASSSSLRNAMEEPEKDYLLSILRKVDWNCSMAAIELDVSRTTLYKKMNRYGITPPKRGRGRKERAGRNDN